MSKEELHPQTTIPFEDLNLFRLTHAYQVPWVNPVSYWVPTNGDIKAMGAIARFVSSDSRILDIGCGNGFVSHLLASEVHVIGIDPNEDLLKSTPYKHSQLELVTGTAEDVMDMFSPNSVDIVLSSWMPLRVDLSDSIYRLNPKIIIFVRDKWNFTGTKKAYQNREDYSHFTSWVGLTTADVGAYFGEICKRLDPFHPYKYYSADEAMSHPNWETVFNAGVSDGVPFARGCNLIDIRIRSDIAVPKLPLEVGTLTPYSWEADLERVFKNIQKFESFDDSPIAPPIRVANA